MRAQPCGLQVARCLVIVIVEPGLADAHHLGVLGELDQLACRNARFFACIVRVRADRAEHIVVGLGNAADAVELTYPCRDRHPQADTGLDRAGDDRVSLFLKVREVEVAMTVDEHRAYAPAAASSAST